MREDQIDSAASVAIAMEKNGRRDRVRVVGLALVVGAIAFQATQDLSLAGVFGLISSIIWQARCDVLQLVRELQFQMMISNDAEDLGTVMDRVRSIRADKTQWRLYGE